MATPTNSDCVSLHAFSLPTVYFHTLGDTAIINHLMCFLSGSCEGAADGLYYVNADSFAFCSNGIKSVQKCAEGSANHQLDYYHAGNYYTHGDFCSVNLVGKK